MDPGKKSQRSQKSTKENLDPQLDSIAQTGGVERKTGGVEQQQLAGANRATWQSRLKGGAEDEPDDGGAQVAATGMQRPLWTLCFFCIWILVLPGILLTHLSLIKLIPEVGDLPDNIVQGFDEVFKFAYLEADSEKVKGAADDAIKPCLNTSQTSATFCPNVPETYYGGKAPADKVADAKDRILAGFASSLAVVERVANDKYLGTEGLQDTANQLNTITEKIKDIPEDGPMECSASLQVFCPIFNSADGIVGGMAMVTAEIDKFKESDIIKRWDKYKGLLTSLHAMPYSMVIALLFFTLFWYRGGVCCCCRGGTPAGFGLVFMAIFWLVSFILYVIVLGFGIALSVMQDKIEVPVLKGKPSLKDAIDHLEFEYPEFWEVVFEGMVDGLDLLYKSSWFFTAVALVIVIYSLCECCCCPYRRNKGAKLKYRIPDATE